MYEKEDFFSRYIDMLPFAIFVVVTSPLVNYEFNVELIGLDAV